MDNFIKQLNQTNLESIQEVKKLCLEQMERKQKEVETKPDGTFYLLYELYGLLWHKENELINKGE